MDTSEIEALDWAERVSVTFVGSLQKGKDCRLINGGVGKWQSQLIPAAV